VKKEISNARRERRGMTRGRLISSTKSEDGVGIWTHSSGTERREGERTKWEKLLGVGIGAKGGRPR